MTGEPRGVSHRDRVIISTRLLYQVADYVETAENLRTKDDVVRFLRDFALVLDLKEFAPEIDLGGSPSPRRRSPAPSRDQEH